MEIKPNKFYTTMFVIAYWGCTIAYFHSMFEWHRTNYPFETIIFLIHNVIVTILYCWLCQSDPGVVHPSSKNDMNVRYF